ncbi:hypothetical protein BX600DRAFT_442626 [Xylariales sp. PMI_506]|nr:hypothetical protein BX600DRAFT_442626 [Xylariales sp. PMI_506]
MSEWDKVSELVPYITVARNGYQSTVICKWDNIEENRPRNAQQVLVIVQNFARNVPTLKLTAEQQLIALIIVSVVIGTVFIDAVLSGASLLGDNFVTGVSIVFGDSTSGTCPTSGPPTCGDTNCLLSDFSTGDLVCDSGQYNGCEWGPRS